MSVEEYNPEQEVISWYRSMPGGRDAILVAGRKQLSTEKIAQEMEQGTAFGRRCYEPLKKLHDKVKSGQQFNPLALIAIMQRAMAEVDDEEE